MLSVSKRAIISLFFFQIYSLLRHAQHDCISEKKSIQKLLPVLHRGKTGFFFKEAAKVGRVFKA
jgi:hypothetical protein